MPNSIPASARATAFRLTASIAVVNLAGFLFGTFPAFVPILFNVSIFVAALWLFALRADRADRRAVELRQEGRRVLADHIRFAQELAAAITRHPAEGSDAQLIRVEIVQLFFAHASRLDVTEHEMQDLLRDTDPIVIADVVISLTTHHSPLMDEHVPWSAFVKTLPKLHSDLCHRPLDRLSWNRSLPPTRTLPGA